MCSFALFAFNGRTDPLITNQKDGPCGISRWQGALSPRHSQKTGDKTPSLLPPPPPPPGSKGRLSRSHRSVAEEGLGAESSKCVPNSPRRTVLQVSFACLLFITPHHPNPAMYIFFSLFLFFLTHSNINLLLSPSLSPSSRELWMQKLKSHLVRTQNLNVLPLKPIVGQYLAIYATLTARDFFLAYFYPSGPFTCIFS